MEERFWKALTAALRAFADTMESENVLDGAQGTPTVGSADSMYHVLREVARINDEHDRGVTRREMSEIARAAGMDPRGMAGYYTRSASLLRIKSGGRWITSLGRKRIQRLATILGRSEAA